MRINVTDSSQPDIKKGSLVTLHFSLSLSSGEVIDSTFDKEPASFRVGDGNMMPGFESELIGLKNGDEFEKTIPRLRAFGEANPQNIQRFPIEKFRHVFEDESIPAVAGSVISFKDSGGFDLAGVIKEISEKEILVDFNHPLSGKDIIFKVNIVAVVSADKDTVAIKV